MEADGAIKLKKRQQKKFNVAQKLRNKYDYEDVDDLVEAADAGPYVVTDDDIRKDIDEEFRDFEDPCNVFSIRSFLLNCFFTVIHRKLDK